MSRDLKTEMQGKDALDQVILGIAHELNNPNAFIRLCATNLRKLFWLLRPCLEEYQRNNPDAKLGPYSTGELRSKVNKQIESILEATVRIIVIADKLKNCTTDSLSSSSKLSMVEIVRDTVSNHQFLLGRLAEFSFDYEEDRDYSISGYRLQLEQAVSALLTNACDAIRERFGEEEDEKGRVAIKLELEDDMMVFTLSDNGCGMDQNVLEKAAVPYFTTKPQGTGDGLGLAICRSIVERHEGAMNITSNPGEGTEIIIKIPKKGG